MSCKNNNTMIDTYEKTILRLIASYLRAYPEHVELMNNIACFLGVNFDLDIIQQYINEECFNDLFHLDYDLLKCIINYYLIQKSIKEIGFDCSKKTLEKNYNIYKSISDNICMMNMNAGAYECMCNHAFSREHAPQSFESFHPTDYTQILDAFVVYADYYDKNKDYLPIIYEIISYQLISHSLAMFLIIIMQVIKHSVYLNDTVKKIASEIYDNTHKLLKDACIIVMRTNFLYFDIEKPFENRTRESDNTTRLHIVYGYDNFDAYSLRFDFCHQGINWIHYNNESPGKVSSYCFTKQEYDSIVFEFPKMKNCFIEHNKCYFLKERINCELDEFTEFDKIEDAKKHAYAFNQEYSESDVLFVLDLINIFLTNVSQGYVDKTGEAAKYAFNLDYLMCRLELLNICRIAGNTEYEKIFANTIVDKAVNYGLLNDNEKESFNSLEGLCMIIKLAKERCGRIYS